MCMCVHLFSSSSSVLQQIQFLIRIINIIYSIERDRAHKWCFARPKCKCGLFSLVYSKWNAAQSDWDQVSTCQEYSTVGMLSCFMSFNTVELIWSQNASICLCIHPIASVDSGDINKGQCASLLARLNDHSSYWQKNLPQPMATLSNVWALKQHTATHKTSVQLLLKPIQFGYFVLKGLRVPHSSFYTD